MKVLQLRSRQKDCRINLRLLKGMVGCVLNDLLVLSDYEIAIHLVSIAEITRLNETFLKHEGPTDVITFEYSSSPPKMSGEVFVCVSEAIQQAPRFHQTWQCELLRYVLHGLLHLRGYDDHLPAKRSLMRRMENKWLRALTTRFEVSDLAFNCHGKA